MSTFVATGNGHESDSKCLAEVERSILVRRIYISLLPSSASDLPHTLAKLDRRGVLVFPYGPSYSARFYPIVPAKPEHQSALFPQPLRSVTHFFALQSGSEVRFLPGARFFPPSIWRWPLGGPRRETSAPERRCGIQTYLRGKDNRGEPGAKQNPENNCCAQAELRVFTPRRNDKDARTRRR